MNLTHVSHMDNRKLLLTRLRRAPQKLVEQLTLIPEIINGVTQAYRFERVGHSRVLDELDIQVGDRLTAVNGIPVDLVPSISRYLVHASLRGCVRLHIEGPRSGHGFAEHNRERDIEFSLTHS